MGNDKAVSVYSLLVDHTANIAKSVEATRIVYYSETITDGDAWDGSYLKSVQHGGDLGERMANAFNDNLETGAKKVVMIRTDCYQLSGGIIADAFKRLDHHDVVIGPALDGGYYLLGIKAYHPELFTDIAWSTDSVLKETLARCNSLSLNYFLLLVLSDVDEEKDLANTDIIDKL